MGRHDDKPGAAGSPRKFPSYCHELLGMTHPEALADLASRGVAMADVLADRAALVARLRASAHRPGALDSGPPPMALEEPAALLAGLDIYEEAAYAGPGGWSGGDGLRRAATLSDFFGRQDWPSVVVARVSGTSMRDDHIVDGDVVLVDTKREPRDGDLVMAHLPGHGQVVKRLRARGGSVSLESSNPDVEPIEVDDPASLAIQGVVVARAGQV